MGRVMHGLGGVSPDNKGCWEASFTGKLLSTNSWKEECLPTIKRLLVAGSFKSWGY